MSYKDKYIKYKQKYLELLIQTRTPQTHNLAGGKVSISTQNDLLTNEIKIRNDVLKQSFELKNYYNDFWTNIYNNDAFIYHKISIDYYKNIYNNKFHSFFSSIINKKLYTGRCQYINNDDRKDFNNSQNNLKINSDDLCNLSVSVINNLDNVFNVCPTLPNNIICYRTEWIKYNKLKNDELKKIDNIANLNVGDYYTNKGYMSTSIDPYLYYWRFPPRKDELIIMYTMMLPKNTHCYYINMPFGIIDDKDLNLPYGFQEYEILLPRNNFFKITNIRKIKNILFVEMQLIHQTKTQQPVSPNNDKISSQVLTKNEYKNLEKDNLIGFDNDFDNNLENTYQRNIKISILNSYKKLWKKIPFELKNIYFLSSVKNIYLKEWLKKDKPKYDTTKYEVEKFHINKEEFNDIYDNFIEAQKHFKRINKFYLQIAIDYRGDNNTYKQFLNIKNNKIIKFDKPQIIYTQISNDIIFSNNFICYKENNIYKENPAYPVNIIIKVSKSIEYLPQYADYNVTFDLDKIKIVSFKKINLFNDFYIIVVNAV